MLSGGFRQKFILPASACWGINFGKFLNLVKLAIKRNIRKMLIMYEELDHFYGNVNL